MNGFPFTVTKHFGHGRGLSTCFRQHSARGSHCRFLHGYALAVTFVIGCQKLDERNWCFHFGGFQKVKAFLERNFDHKTIIAVDDPLRQNFEDLHRIGGCDLRITPTVGCEAFAKEIFIFAQAVVDEESGGRAKLLSVCVSEHESNSATYHAQ